MGSWAQHAGGVQGEPASGCGCSRTLWWYLPEQRAGIQPPRQGHARVCQPNAFLLWVQLGSYVIWVNKQIVLLEVSLAAHEADHASSAFGVVICSSVVYGSTDLSVPTPSLCLCGDTKPARGGRYERLVAQEGQHALNVPMKVAITRCWEPLSQSPSVSLYSKTMDSYKYKMHFIVIKAVFILQVILFL